MSSKAWSLAGQWVFVCGDGTVNQQVPRPNYSRSESPSVNQPHQPACKTASQAEPDGLDMIFPESRRASIRSGSSLPPLHGRWFQGRAKQPAPPISSVNSLAPMAVSCIRWHTGREIGAPLPGHGQRQCFGLLQSKIYPSPISRSGLSCRWSRFRCRGSLSSAEST